ncbi:MAG: hypothetical protein OEX08_03725, partial [Candidatus Nomurabacteria bacterium]|nr:hypothetical protein [Candidatus Nomurabacteria bacterium]
MNNIEIIPAIMPNSYNDLLEKSGQVSDVVSIVQIDVMDGIFVPEKTWPYVDSADEHFARMINEEEGLPNAEKIDYELDLMIQSPDTDFDKWVALQPRRIIVHIESLENPENFFAKV